MWRWHVAYLGLRAVIVFLFARSLFALGYSEAAVALLQRGLRRAHPVHKPMFVLQIADTYERMGRAGDAIAVINEAIRAEPNEATAASYYFELASIHENAGEKDSALANFDRALALGTDFGEEFRVDLKARIARLKGR
jgi:tetratricopeptide (TPR) repeat protein